MPSRLPVKRRLSKKPESKKWDNNTKVKPPEHTGTSSNLQKIVKSPMPYVLRSLTPDSELDSFLQKKAPEPGTSRGAERINRMNNQRQNDKVSFATIQLQHESKIPTYPKRDRNYPKPWLTRPIQVDFTEQYAFNARGTQAKRLLNVQPRRQLAKNQKPRPQFASETKELAILYANSRREFLKSERESKMINNDDHIPPWRRDKNEAEDESKFIVQPPQIIGTKLKLEAKPKTKERVTLKVPKFSQRSEDTQHYRKADRQSRSYPKPWRMQYQHLPNDDKGIEVKKSVPSKKKIDKNANGMERGNTAKTAKNQVNDSSRLLNAPKLDDFTFEDAVKGIQKDKSRQVYDVKVELPNPFNVEYDLSCDEKLPEFEVNFSKNFTRMPLKTQYFPKAGVEASNVVKSKKNIGKSSFLTTIPEDEYTTDFETDVEEIANDDNQGNETEISEITEHHEMSADETIVPHVIRSGEFHQQVPNTTDESSTSEDEGNQTEERNTTLTSDEGEPCTSNTISKTVRQPDSVFPDNSKRNETQSDLSDVDDSKKCSTRLPVPTYRRNGLRRRKHIAPYSFRSGQQKKAVHHSSKPVTPEFNNTEIEKTNDEEIKPENMFTSMSYTIVKNENGPGMMKLYPDGTTIGIPETNNPGLRSIVFCSSDMKCHVNVADHNHPNGIFNGASASASTLDQGIKNKLSYTVSGAKDSVGKQKLNTKSYVVVGQQNHQLSADITMPPGSIPIPNPLLKNYIQSIPTEEEKVCYTANVIWNRTPFTSPHLTHSEMLEYPRDEFMTLLPPPTPYSDGKIRTDQIISPSGYPEGQNQMPFYSDCNRQKQEGFSHQQPFGLNIINLNYMSSSSSQSLGKSKSGCNKHKSRNRNGLEGGQMYQDRQQNIEYPDSRNYEQQCHCSNKQHPGTYGSYCQHSGKPITQYASPNYSRIPEGHFLPPLVPQVHQENQKCDNRNCCSFRNCTNSGPTYLEQHCQHHRQMSSNENKNYPFQCPNQNWPKEHPCNYSHHHRCEYEPEYRQHENWQSASVEKGNRVRPFAPVNSSTSFTMTADSSHRFQSQRKSVVELHNYKTKGGSRGNPNYSTYLNKTEEHPSQKINFRYGRADYNNNVVRLNEKESSKNFYNEEDSNSSDNGNSDEEYSDDFEDDWENTGAELPESKNSNDQNKLGQANFTLRKYLLEMLLKKPSTPKRMRQELETTAPPPTPATEDSSKASLRVLLSRNGSNTLQALPNCNCARCRNINLDAQRSQSLGCLDQINYVRKNIKDMKKYKKQVPAVPQKVVDHPKGDRRVPLIQYTGRKGYGQVPEYIKKRKGEILAEKQAQLEAELQNTIQKINAIENRRKVSRRQWIKMVADHTRAKLQENQEEEELCQDQDKDEIQIQQKQQSHKSRSRRTQRSGNSTMTAMPTALCDNIYIGSYHPSEESLEKLQTSKQSIEHQVKPSEQSNEQQVKTSESSSIFNVLPAMRLRGGITTAPGRLNLCTPRPHASISDSFLYVHHDLGESSHSLPDNVEYL